MACIEDSLIGPIRQDLRMSQGVLLTIVGGDKNLHRLHGGLGVEGLQGVLALEEGHAVHATWRQRSVTARYVHLHSIRIVKAELLALVSTSWAKSVCVPGAL